MNATAGADIIGEQIAVDEQAAYLGETALVDGSSAVKRTRLVFCDTLFDENATCHIACGGGIPTTLGVGAERRLKSCSRRRLATLLAARLVERLASIVRSSEAVFR